MFCVDPGRVAAAFTTANGDPNKIPNTKTKEMIVDFRKQHWEHHPIHINGTAVEKVERFKFLGIHITDKLKWSTHTDSVGKKAQQPLQPQEAEEIWLVT